MSLTSNFTKNSLALRVLGCAVSIVNSLLKIQYYQHGKKAKDDYINAKAHLKEIIGTNLLISLQNRWDTSANMKIFDISMKEKAKEIYAFEETLGCKCQIQSVLTVHNDRYWIWDLTYNPRRNILGALSVRDKIAYHLFNIGHTRQKNKDDVKLLKKLKWPEEYDFYTSTSSLN